jgi:pimeloyl-ACP methyl ester carboxylesterase
VLRRAAFTVAFAWICCLELHPAAARAVNLTARRDDGSVIHWSLDRQQARSKQGILVVAQGSGCLPTAINPNLARAKRLLPAFAVVMVEKYGVRPGAAPKDQFGGCSRAFYRHHTVSQRAADYERVLGAAEASPWWDGRLVLFGGSEDGAAVAMLAPKTKPTAVVIFSTAPGRSFRKTFKLAPPPDVAAQVDSELAKIDADPLSTKLWGGNSYRWWADILDHDLTADVLAVRAPILLVQGERDAPVEVARQVRDDFERAGHCNLTYWEFPGYDHFMKDAAGRSHIDDVLQRISGWLAEKISAESTGERCLPEEPRPR